MDLLKVWVERCVRIMLIIDVFFLEKYFIGDVLVMCFVLFKLYCEDFCMRNLYCIGFNYKEYKCEILSDIYNVNDKDMS